MTVAPPNPKFIKARYFGGVDKVKRKWVVIHSTTGPCKPGQAEAIAQFFAHESAKTSAHFVVDTAERRQCVPLENVAYHCGYNYGSVAVEMCEDPNYDITRWDDTNHRLLELNAANLVARLCLVEGIRPYFVGVAGLKLGISGVTTHANMSKAFKQSVHWDPGAFRRLRFMRQVRKHYRYLKSKNA